MTMAAVNVLARVDKTPVARRVAVRNVDHASMSVLIMTTPSKKESP
jgi:hypothetical protein